MDVKEAIQTSAEALRRLLTRKMHHEPTRSSAGDNGCVLAHPLHYVSDMLFSGTLRKAENCPDRGSDSSRCGPEFSERP